MHWQRRIFFAAVIGGVGTTAFPMDQRVRLPPSHLDLSPPQDMGTGRLIDAEEVFILRGQIARCWTPPLDKALPLVKVMIRLDLDGSIAAPPQVVNSPSDGQIRELFERAAKSAVAAVLKCTDAFAALPPEAYLSWRNIQINFDAKEIPASWN